MYKLDIASCFNTEPPELRFVVPGMIEGSVGALISPGGAGKSMLALQVLVQIASGANTLEWDHDLIRGKVAYLAAEDPDLTLWHRLHEMKSDLDEGVKTLLIENLNIYPLFGKSVDLMDADCLKEIKKAASDCRLVVIDTMRRFHVKNENDSGEMTQVLNKLEAICAETGASIMFLHHSSKVSTLSGSVGEQQSSRGSSVLVDNVRWQGFISGMTQKEAEARGVSEEDRKFLVRFGISKHNYCPPMCDIWFERKAGGVLKKTKVDDPITPTGRRNPKKKNEKNNKQL